MSAKEPTPDPVIEAEASVTEPKPETACPSGAGKWSVAFIHTFFAVLGLELHNAFLFTAQVFCN